MQFQKADLMMLGIIIGYKLGSALIWRKKSKPFLWLLLLLFYHFVRPEQLTDMLAKFYANERLSGIYYAYHVLHRYLEEPFTSFMPEALFNIARFAMSQLKDSKPKGVSNLYPFFVVDGVK